MESKKQNEQLAALLNGLTGEQKAKAKACKTVEELTSLLSDLGVPLPDELLDNVSGGGAQDEMDLLILLAKWDEECSRRGIDVHDSIRREEVWRELNQRGY